MTAFEAGSAPLWPMGVYFALAVLLTVVMLVASYLLGQHHQEAQTGETYEGGIESTGTAQIRFSVKFYLVAMFFVVFDLEAVFILAWAVALREAGWSGFIEAVIFIVVLVAALVYLWKAGALDVGPAKKTVRNANEREGAYDK